MTAISVGAKDGSAPFIVDRYSIACILPSQRGVGRPTQLYTPLDRVESAAKAVPLYTPYSTRRYLLQIRRHRATRPFAPRVHVGAVAARASAT